MTYRDQLCTMFAGKNIHVVGLGTQGGGLATANTLAACGANVSVWDEKPAAQLATTISQLAPHINGHYGAPIRGQDLLSADIIIKNPAVPFDHPALQPAVAANITVTTETALALAFCRDKTIGITGTRGKTTTTHIIHHILKQAGYAANLGGNIPQKPTLAILANATHDDWFVIEISSFHLEAMHRTSVSPHFAILTSLSPDHLNRYASYAEYQQTKLAIFAHQQPGDHAFWLATPETESWSVALLGTIPSGVNTHPLTSEEVSNYHTHYPHQLAGKHNDENVALAVAVGKTFDIADTLIQQAIATFPGVPYRLQPVAKNNGISWINDTTATTPVALEKALATWPKSAIFIIGGATKHLPFSESLLAQLRARLANIVWLAGSGTQELLAALGPHNSTIAPHESMIAACQQAWVLAQKQAATAIILSPGFASFEYFRHEFDRGDQFNSIVTANKYL